MTILGLALVACGSKEAEEPLETIMLDFKTQEGFTSSMGDFAFDKENNLYAIWHISPVYVEGKEYEESDYKTYLVRYTSDLVRRVQKKRRKLFRAVCRYM